MTRRLDPRLAAVSLVVVASGAEARFLPPEGRILRQVLTEERIDGGKVQRFLSERTIIFRRTADGYRAELRIVSENHAADGAGAMFGAGIAALKASPIQFDLDREGSVVAIVDEDRLWTRFCDAIEGMARGPGALDAQRTRNLQALAAPFRAMPPARRRALLGSMISAIIAGPLADRQPGTQPITLPARDVQGQAVALPGTETVAIGDGALTIDSIAEGDLNPSAHLVVSRRERVDVARGLILETTTRRDTLFGTGPSARRSTTVVSSVISIAVF